MTRMLVRLRRWLGDEVALERGWMQLAAKINPYCDHPGCDRRGVSVDGYGRQFCERHQ